MARDRAVDQASAWFFKRLEAEEAGNPRSSHVLRSGTGVHGGFERCLRGLPDVRVICVPFERSSLLHRAPSAGCRPPSRTSAYFGRQHFFLKYLFTFRDRSHAGCSLSLFPGVPGRSLKYKPPGTAEGGLGTSAPALPRLLFMDLKAAGSCVFLPEWQRRVMEAFRADFELAARSTILSPPDPSPKSILSTGPRPESQHGRDARYSFSCPDCGWGQTQNRSFVVIVSLCTDFVLRSSFANQNAHIPIVVFPLYLAHAIVYVIRVVSAVEHARHVQYIMKLHRPKICICHPPVIASPPTEFASTPVVHVDLRFYGNSQEAQDGGPVEVGTTELRHPNLTGVKYALKFNCR